MKPAILIAVILFGSFQIQAQSPTYDSVLAKKLKADNYGMKRYYLVILKTGSSDITDKKKLDSIFGGHMKNIQALAAQNKLSVAGPLSKNDKQYRGIYVLNTDNKEEAEKMVEADPAVQAKVLAAEYYPWYASAALQQVTEIHNKITKEKM